ncbi:hypothetical protein NW062_00845 [Mycoplasmopsis cynos]|nr:hypothetical protein NW062_00845 [Mycoplasmopsis cynos]
MKLLIKSKKYISEPTTLNFIELPPKDKNIETASLYNLTILRAWKN